MLVRYFGGISKYKKQNGITLIALVITIIILLILAGVVLNLTIGENGIIAKAQQAGKNYDEASAREKLELALVDLQAQKVVDSTYNETTYIDNYLEKKQMTVNGNIVTVGKWQFEIDRSVPKIASSLGKGDQIITEQKANLTLGNMIDGQIMLKIEVALPNDTIQGIEIYDETNTKVETLSVPEGTKQIQKEQEIYVEFMEEKSYYAKIIGENSNIQTNTVNVKNENVITTASDLKKLATLVNSGETFEGKEIIQVEDIDLSTVCGSGIGNWNPIGYASANSHWFDGTYDGKGKKVTNLYINNAEDKTMGLFGFLGYEGTVKNITVEGEVRNTVERLTGGIIGRNEGTIENCINNVNVQNAVSGCGGVAGGNYSIIKNCINNGNVKGSNIEGTGGIVGNGNMALNTIISTTNIDLTKEALIENCTNSISTKIESNEYVGGICGRSSTNKINNCINNGEVVASSSIVGGIVGSSDVDITNCKNTGAVTSQGNPSDSITTQGTGGIVGRTTANVNFSSNEGTIKSEGYFVGGIIGIGGENTIVGQCYNKGSIEAKQNAVGGIVGNRAGGGIWNSYNYLSGDKYIKANYNVGGIMGNASGDTTTVIINCYSIGENIIGNSNASILGAYYISGNRIYNCYYMMGSSLNGIGTERIGDLEANDIITKNLSDFKLPKENSNSVTNLLTNENSPVAWAQDDNINDGLPYLVNNRPE